METFQLSFSGFATAAAGEAADEAACPNPSLERSC